MDEKADPGQEPAESFFRNVNIEFLIHELKDPLSVIETNVRLLLGKPDGPIPFSRNQSGCLQRILRGALRARGMLYELLEVGRAESACFDCRSFHPLPVVREVLLEMLASAAADIYARIDGIASQADQFKTLAALGIRLDASPDDAGVTIHQDEAKFRRIVANLLKNALSYRRRMVLVHLSCQRGNISLAVRDDGPGIAAEHHESIFGRYKQVHACAEVARSGHGLGLAVSRILARSMGGDIVLESQLGMGALFRMILPMQFPGAPEAASACAAGD